MQEFIQSKVMPVLLVVTTVMGIFNTIQNNKLDAKSKEIKFTLDSLSFIDKQKEIDRKDIEFTRELKFKLFEEVKYAIKSNNSQLQKTVYEFVTQMIVEDEQFRNALLKSLENSQSVTQEVREKITENFRNQQLFKSQEIVAPTQQTESVADNPTIRVDIFYLEENENISKPLAEKVKAKLAATNKYTLRLRVLPKLTNAQNGYLVYSNEIRFDTGEKELAESIAQLINPIFSQPVTQKTLWTKKVSKDNYVSVFVRGE